MAIARFENVDINNLSFAVNAFGEGETLSTKWFTTRAKVSDVKNSVQIAEKYRVYQDLVNLQFNYTPNMKRIVDQQDLYSLIWRGITWRITDVFESDDRMKITLLCYRNDPETSV